MFWKFLLLSIAHSSAVGKSLVSLLSDSTRGTAQSCLEVSLWGNQKLGFAFLIDGSHLLPSFMCSTRVLARSFRSDVTPELWHSNQSSLSISRKGEWTLTVFVMYFHSHNGILFLSFVTILILTGVKFIDLKLHFFFLTRTHGWYSHQSLDNLFCPIELNALSRVTLNFQSSSLYLRSAKIISISHGTQFVRYWGSNPGPCAC